MWMSREERKKEGGKEGGLYRWMRESREVGCLGSGKGWGGGGGDDDDGHHIARLSLNFDHGYILDYCLYLTTS